MISADEQHPEKPATEQTLQRPRFFGPVAIVALSLLTVVLAGAWLLAWRSNDAMANLPFLHGKGGASGAARGQSNLVDQTPWQTAEALTALARTQEEMSYARQAERLADHEVDQAFATALRSASLQQRTLTGDALKIQQNVTMLEGLVAQDSDAVKQLTPKGGDDLDVAQAQLGLDQDQLSDAKQDLARASGDKRGEIQQELTTREADLKKYDASQATGEVAVVSATRYRTLFALVGAFRSQTTRYNLLLEAKADAEHAAQNLTSQHNKMEAAGDVTPSDVPANAALKVQKLKLNGLRRQMMSLYDDRIDTEAQLAVVYGKWAAQVALQHRILQHLIEVQVIYIALILIAAILLSAFVSRLAERDALDQRRMRTLVRIARLAVQVVALIAVLLVVFGPPSQISTVIGLATAGLTVALQDFILAFVGWFILMGRTGIDVGDVVEINAVTGEVMEIGLFRTTLLETGNWTAKGHPTGRRVAFNNKYAISGQFFNFSTNGQWMWDELTVNVAADQDTYAVIERVHKVVADETEADSQQAVQEWQTASRKVGLSQFSAEPAVNVRPASSGGVDLVVRYVTRASARFERRNKLYQCVLETVRPKSDAESSPAPSTA